MRVPLPLPLPLLLLAPAVSRATPFAVPPAPPPSAHAAARALLSVSLEFFAFPAYAALAATHNCLAHLAALRGAPPAVRIGGTTQDRATYDPALAAAVNYTVASPADAPDALTFGPPFVALAGALRGRVTLGLNRQLDDRPASLAAAALAKAQMANLYAIELGNEPEFWDSDSPIVVAGGQGWNQALDAASEAAWFAAFAPSVGDIFQGAVTLSWDAAGLLPLIGADGVAHLRSLSQHAYPQSACGGASTDLPSLMSHAGIVAYAGQYAAGAAAAHAAGIEYFLGETNSATCGGGGISPTFGAALWIVDYVLQGALNGVDRLYFHQGTISNCAYCFWGESSVSAPYYGAAFVSEFLGTDGAAVAMLDGGTGAVGVYAVYSAADEPVRLLVVNTQYYNGTGARPSAAVSFSGLAAAAAGTRQAKRMTAPSAVALDSVTIGGSASFGSDCARSGVQRTESVSVDSAGGVGVSVRASEAVIVFL